MYCSWKGWVRRLTLWFSKLHIRQTHKLNGVMILVRWYRGREVIRRYIRYNKSHPGCGHVDFSFKIATYWYENRVLFWSCGFQNKGQQSSGLGSWWCQVQGHHFFIWLSMFDFAVIMCQYQDHKKRIWYNW